MQTYRVTMLTIAVLAALVATALVVSIAAAGGRPLDATLTGAAEAPGPGDPNGTGSAFLTFNPGRQEVCFEISVADISLPATGAHIHEAPVGSPGAVVVPLAPPDATGTSSGCVSASRELIKTIMQDPDAFYVNVHTTDFPAGAVRGQLAK